MPAATKNSKPKSKPSAGSNRSRPAASRKEASQPSPAAPASSNQSRTLDLKAEESHLLAASAEDRVQWGLETFGRKIVLSSSFGAQSAVCLHLVTRQRPRIPVILVDTGYLFPETYQFIDRLTERLNLNLKTFRPEMSAAWQEARYGRLWEQGVEGIEQYNQINKVEPLRRALRKLGAKAWISGIRRDQSQSREKTSVIAVKEGIIKLHPIFDWNDRDIYEYLQEHDLPYHPLWDEGYISIGDWHTSHKLTDVSSKDHVRFHGLKRECGMHEDAKEIAEGMDYVI